VTKVNWKVASQQFNPDAQTTSFRTMTSRALARVTDALAKANDPASSGSEDASSATPTKGKGTPQGNKRKAGGQTGSPSTKRKATPKSTAKGKVDAVDTAPGIDTEDELGKYWDRIL
jgi:hypothetical protein